MAIRSGRFKFSNPSGGTATIIEGVNRASATYRIFNSGEGMFAVTQNSTDVELWPACSVDVTAGDVEVTAGTALKGSYDFLYDKEYTSDYVDAENPPRAGRFKIDGNTASEITIVQGTFRLFYRIFNSGNDAFTVQTAPGHTWSLKPTYSYDVYAKDDLVIKAGTDLTMEGIYDCLDTRKPVRSGRFKIWEKTLAEDGEVVDPTIPHKIIDLREGGNKPVWYRIFNSGSHPLTLNRGSSSTKEIEAEQSYDFEVGKSVKEVFVKSTDTKIPIEGVYEFLGRES